MGPTPSEGSGVYYSLTPDPDPDPFFLKRRFAMRTVKRLQERPCRYLARELGGWAKLHGDERKKRLRPRPWHDLIDTAEMYGEGVAEKVVGDAIASRRDEVYLVSKVPHNATRRGTIEACERSLQRLRTDRLDPTFYTGGGSTPYQKHLRRFKSCVRLGNP